MISKQTFIATHRFGFGPNENDIKQAKNNPKDWLYAQISGFDPKPDLLRDLPTTEEAIAYTKKTMSQRRAMKKAKMSKDAMRKAKRSTKKEIEKAVLSEIELRTKLAVTTPTPLMERLVHFWSNHFTISTARKETINFIGPYEREAIRPNILGKFSDLVISAIQHPGMLVYLDNLQSVGPNSKLGRRKGKGLNENLAREVLELHTLGVNGGYTQTDVQEFAKMLTGWTVNRNLKRIDKGAYFEPRIHEPGSKTLLGKIYPESGADEVKKAIIDICNHPSCAEFIATKMVRHFIADIPPKSAVKKLKRTYLKTGGDLTAMTVELIKLPESWDTTLAKVKSHDEFITSILRIFHTYLPVEPKGLFMALKHLNHIPFSAPSPAGWKDIAQTWATPESIIRRIELSRLVAINMHKEHDIDIKIALDNTLGDMASETTRLAILRAPSRIDAMTLLFTSPEFQRR